VRSFDPFPMFFTPPLGQTGFFGNATHSYFCSSGPPLNRLYKSPTSLQGAVGTFPDVRYFRRKFVAARFSPLTLLFEAPFFIEVRIRPFFLPSCWQRSRGFWRGTPPKSWFQPRGIRPNFSPGGGQYGFSFPPKAFSDLGQSTVRASPLTSNVGVWRPPAAFSPLAVQLGAILDDVYPRLSFDPFRPQVDHS